LCALPVYKIRNYATPIVPLYRQYLTQQDTTLIKFDEDLFRRLIEKVKVQSMVEAVFVFKTGVEVKAIYLNVNALL
jgi:hypothetical protein